MQSFDNPKFEFSRALGRYALYCIFIRQCNMRWQLNKIGGGEEAFGEAAPNYIMFGALGDEILDLGGL